MPIPWMSELSWEFNDALKEGRLAQIDPMRLNALLTIGEAAASFKPRPTEENQSWVTDNYDGGELREAVNAAEKIP